MRRQKLIKTSIVIIGFLIVIISFFFNFSPSKNQGVRISSTQSISNNLWNHPIYSQYDFDQSDHIINIGIQPLYLPSGIIFEAMKKDNILAREVSQLNMKNEYYPFLKGEDVNFFLQQQKLDGGVGGDMPALSAASKIDIIVPLCLQEGNASIVSAERLLANDMKGKRIAYPFGSISHYFILDLLHSAGISENQVKLIPMEVTSMADALHNKEIDLFSAWEPIVSLAKKQYPSLFIDHRTITTGYLYFSEDFVVRHRDAVYHILAAAIRAINWMKADRRHLISACKWNINQIEKLTGQKSMLTEEEIASLAEKDISYHFSAIIKQVDFQPNSRLHSEYRFLKKINIIPSTSKWEDVCEAFDHQMIITIIKQSEKYRIMEFDYE